MWPYSTWLLRAALGARGEYVLLADLLEERVLGQQRHGGEGRQRHRNDRQRQVPEIIADLGVPRQLPEILRDQPAQREPVEERAAGEQDDQQNREQEAGNGVADDDHARGPHVEARAGVDRLADAERDRDQVGEQRHPDAERDRHRQLLLDQLHHADVAEIALAEIEADIVPQHNAEALIGRLVEAELLFQLLDEFRIEPLRAAVFRRHGVDARAALHQAAAAEVAAGRAGNARGRAGVGAGELGDHLLDRPAGRELHHDERHQHDAEHGRHHEQQAADDVGGHADSQLCHSGAARKRQLPSSRRTSPFVPTSPPCRGRTTTFPEYPGNSAVLSRAN